MPIRITKEEEVVPGLKSYDFLTISKTMDEKIKPTEAKISNLINECGSIETACIQVLNNTHSQIIIDDIPYDNADYHYIETLLQKVRTAIAALSGSNH